MTALNFAELTKRLPLSRLLAACSYRQEAHLKNDGYRTIPSQPSTAIDTVNLFLSVRKSWIPIIIHDGMLKAFIDDETVRGMASRTIHNAIAVVSAVLNRAARVWRTEAGAPWLRRAPPLLTHFLTKGRQAKPHDLSCTEQDKLFRLLPGHLEDAALFALNTGYRDQEICQLCRDRVVAMLELESSGPALPESITRTGTERIVVSTSVAAVRSPRGVEYIQPMYSATAESRSASSTAARRARLERRRVCRRKRYPEGRTQPSPFVRSATELCRCPP
jgi:hypothetical protein